MIESITNKIFETFINFKFSRKGSEDIEFYSYLREKQKEKILSLHFLLLSIYVFLSLLSLYWIFSVSPYFIFILALLIFISKRLYIETFPETNFLLYKTDYYTLKGINRFASAFAPYTSMPKLLKLEFKLSNFSYSAKDAKRTNSIISKLTKCCEKNQCIFSSFSMDLKAVEFTFYIYSKPDSKELLESITDYFQRENISNMKLSKIIENNWETYEIQMKELMEIVSRKY